MFFLIKLTFFGIKFKLHSIVIIPYLYHLSIFFEYKGKITCPERVLSKAEGRVEGSGGLKVF
jgi:hypothetical protein